MNIYLSTQLTACSMLGRECPYKLRIIPTTLIYLKSSVGGSTSSYLTNVLAYVGIQFTCLFPASNTKHSIILSAKPVCVGSRIPVSPSCSILMPRTPSGYTSSSKSTPSQIRRFAIPSISDSFSDHNIKSSTEQIQINFYPTNNNGSSWVCFIPHYLIFLVSNFQEYLVL